MSGGHQPAFRWGAPADGFRGRIEDFGHLNPVQHRAIRKGLKLMCREIQMGVAAAQRALSDAGSGIGQYDPERTGVVFGCDHIVTLPEEFTSAVARCMDRERGFEFQEWGRKGLAAVTPLWLLKYLPNMPASHVAIYNDLRGPNNSLTYREASANIALGEAAAKIRRGLAELMVAGATGSSLAPLRSIQLAVHSPWAQNGDDPSMACRPFDRDRSGSVGGEGAAALVLEGLAEAQARGARIYGEVLGHGSSLVIDRDSVADIRRASANAMRAALDSAGLRARQVGHVQAHGAASRQGDIDESRAIQDVFGPPPAVPVTAAKSYFGNLGAGGGCVELIAGLLALRQQRLFPVLHCTHPDPACPIQVVTTDGVAPGRTLLNLNYTPQGQASAVIVGLPEFEFCTFP